LADEGFSVPVISPEKAGENLAALAGENHLTLYEYFQTDRAGHSRDIQTALVVLKELQVFLSVVVERTDLQETLLMITSDHGNIEDLSVKAHTGNPVPLVARGWKSEEVLSGIGEITAVTPTLVQLPFD